MPDMCGVAKLLPVQRILLPPTHATLTSTPRAKNSTGGSQVVEEDEGITLLVAGDGDHGRELPRVALDRHVVRGGDEHRALEVSRVRELVQDGRKLALRRREAHVDDVEALLDRPLQAAEEDAPDPVKPAPSTRTLTMSHSGASERTTPAQAVPDVPAEITFGVLLHNRLSVGVQRDRHGPADVADELVAVVDAAVECRRSRPCRSSRPTPLPRDLDRPFDGQGDPGGLSGREAPGWPKVLRHRLDSTPLPPERVESPRRRV